MSVWASKFELIKELFVRTADENYITARWCAINGLNTDFLWLALHASEKYLKAVLLANGKSSQEYGHNVVRLYSEVKTIVGPLLPGTLTKPAELDIYRWFDKTSEQFMEHLLRNGNADNRYLIYGYTTHSQDLHMLDAMVFAIRRLICPLDESIAGHHHPSAPTHRQTLTKQPTYRHPLFMPLDKLIEAKDDSPARTAALNLNFAFAPPDFEHTPIRSGFSSVNSVILRRILDPLESDNREIAIEGIEVAQWFLANVKVPGKPSDPDVKQQIEAAIRAAKTKHRLP